MDSRPSKRPRMATCDIEQLATPPATDLHHDCVPTSDSLLEYASHILSTEAAALSHVAALYRVSPVARLGLKDAVHAIAKAQQAGGKLVVCGVGKSAYIAMKLVATCKSLGVPASFMHACEAVHGDLGDIRANDVVLFVSFSGKSPELLNVLSHVSETTQIMAVTSHTEHGRCPLFAGRDSAILLPAPIPEEEEEAFGVAAPTISTTVALAVADMLALTVADQLHRTKTKEVFSRNHPGGAIGLNHAAVEGLKENSDGLAALQPLPSPILSGSDDS